jgi:hypothetical protein
VEARFSSFVSAKRAALLLDSVCQALVYEPTFDVSFDGSTPHLVHTVFPRPLSS